MGLIAVDTTFLIDLQRNQEQLRKAITDFLGRHAEDEFCISVTALGEFAAGFERTDHRVFLSVKQRFLVTEHDEAVAMEYGRLFRYLKSRGELIGANDLWIAAAAIRHEASLVTRNAADFRRIPGLNVLDY
jgi:tRNA(fMet)-specific endonuclease VapC